MTNDKPVRDRLHSAMHRIPGVPGHIERPAGHQGTVRHGNAVPNPAAHHHSANHTPVNSPRVLVAWQRKIAAFFGQDVC